MKPLITAAVLLAMSFPPAVAAASPTNYARRSSGPKNGKTARRIKQKAARKARQDAR
jgi:hypothetical protein